MSAELKARITELEQQLAAEKDISAKLLRAGHKLKAQRDARESETARLRAALEEAKVALAKLPLEGNEGASSVYWAIVRALQPPDAGTYGPGKSSLWTTPADASKPLPEARIDPSVTPEQLRDAGKGQAEEIRKLRERFPDIPEEEIASWTPEERAEVLAWEVPRFPEKEQIKQLESALAARTRELEEARAKEPLARDLAVSYHWLEVAKTLGAGDGESLAAAARRVVAALDAERALSTRLAAHNEDLRAKLAGAVAFVERTRDWRTRAHAYDADVGHELRDYSDVEEWDRLEEQAIDTLDKLRAPARAPQDTAPETPESKRGGT